MVKDPRYKKQQPPVMISIIQLPDRREAASYIFVLSIIPPR